MDSISRLESLDNLADSILKYQADINRAYFENSFFNIFPNSFNDFKCLYGYSDDSSFSKSPGYELSHKHVAEIFGKLKYIEDSVFAQKIISICVGAKWQADAVNDLQHILKEKLQSKRQIDTYFNQLSYLKQDDLEQFWNFYFTNTDDSKSLDSFDNIKKEFPRVYRVLYKQYKTR